MPSFRAYWEQEQEPPYLGFLPLLAALTPEIIAEIGLAAASITPFVVKYGKPLIVKGFEYAKPLASKTSSLWMSMAPIQQLGAMAVAAGATWAAVNWAATDRDYNEAGKAFGKVLQKYWSGDDLARLVAESAPFARSWMIYAATNGIPANPTSDKTFLANMSKDSGISIYDTSLLIYAMVEAHSLGIMPESVWNGTSKTATQDLVNQKDQNDKLAQKMSWQETALWVGGFFAVAWVFKK